MREVELAGAVLWCSLRFASVGYRSSQTDINDTISGHPAGDRRNQTTSGTDSFRVYRATNDTAARLGGEELALLLARS